MGHFPVDNFGTVVGENPTPYGILALWAVNSLSIVYWVGNLTLLCPSGAMGHQASAQVFSPWMVPLNSNIFHKKNGCAKVWCHSKLLPVTLTR